MGGIVGSIIAAVLKSIGDFFLAREAQQKNDLAQRELERLQLENNALKQSNEQERQREQVVQEVSRLSDADLLSRLRPPGS